MHLKFTTSFLAIGSLVGLAACGGSTTGGAAPSYETLASTATSGTSTIGGTTYEIDKTHNTAWVYDVTGEWDHSTDTATVEGGTYTYSGDEGSLPFTNGDGEYDYVKYVSVTYSVNGISYTSNGQIGIVTDVADMPSDITAQYDGEAWAYYYDSQTSGSAALNHGTSSVVANFTDGVVDAVLTDFTAANVTGTLEIDTIEITDMVISGNTFGGGTIGSYLNGNYVDVLGANVTGVMSGNFYGYDSQIGAPDEIGGTLAVWGDDGQINADFIAD